MKNKIFAYSVLGLNVIAAWLSWWILARVFSGQSAHLWLYPTLAFSFWGIVFVLGCIFVKNKTYLYSSYVAGGAGYLFFSRVDWSFLAIAIAVLFFILAERQVKKEIARGIKIDFYRLVSHGLRYFVTIVCLIVAIVYYFSITSEFALSISGIESRSLEAEIDWGLKAASYVLPKDKKELVDDIRNNITVDDFLIKNWAIQSGNSNLASQRNVSSNDLSGEAMLIGNTAAEQIREEILSRAKGDLSEQLGVPVIGEQPMKEVLLSYIDKTERSFFEYSGSEKFYVPVILAFGLFLTARILSTAVDIFLGLLTLGIIKLLRISGIVGMAVEEREVAVIEYSI